MPNRRRQLQHSHKRLGGPEIVKHDKIRKIHTPNIQGHAFFLGRQSAAGSCGTDAQDWETLKLVRNTHV